MRTLLSAVAAALIGAIAGLILSLAMVIARAQLMDVYVEYVGEALSWAAFVIGGGALIAIAATLADRCRAGRAALLMLGAGLVTTAIGVALGAAFLDQPEGLWAGGVMGCAAGLTLGGLGGLVVACRPA